MLDAIKRVVGNNFFQQDSAPNRHVQRSPTAAVQNSTSFLLTS